MGVQINGKKTEVMKVSDDPTLMKVTDIAFLGQVKSRKLKYFGHVTKHNSLEKDIMLGTMPGTRRQGGQRREWIDNITSGQRWIWWT